MLSVDAAVQLQKMDFIPDPTQELLNMPRSFLHREITKTTVKFSEPMSDSAQTESFTSMNAQQLL